MSCLLILALLWRIFRFQLVTPPPLALVVHPPALDRLHDLQTRHARSISCPIVFLISSQKPSELNDLFLCDHARTMLRIAYDHETVSGAGEHCPCERGIALYNCRDCFQYGVSCKECLMEAHIQLPLHRIFVWSVAASRVPEYTSAEDEDRRRDGGQLANVVPWEPGMQADLLPHGIAIAEDKTSQQFFNRTSLASLGMVMRLGHQGKRCPDRHYLVEPDKEIQTIRVLHENGVHLVRVQYCRCGGLSTFSSGTGDNAPHQQLWRAGLYPATYKQPRTVASLSVLEMFRLLTCEGKINSSAFFTFLRRVGAVVFEEESAVSC